MVEPIGKDGYGKGDTYRPVDSDTYDRNAERVLNPKCIVCGTPMVQVYPGRTYFFCPNRECSAHEKVKRRKV